MTKVNSTFSPTYDWNDKSTILSSFFWGNIVTLFPAGYIATKYGPKMPFCIATIICSIFTIAIPFMARLGSYGVMICRIVQGMTQGFFLPGTSNLLGKWVPPSERSRLGSFVYSGTILGTALSMPITGWFCNSSYGWPSAFFFFGGLGLIWVVAWFFLGANSPSEHKSISIEELEYIEKSFFKSEKPKDIETPWKSFLKSTPLWSLMFVQMAHNWGFWIMVTEIPSYINAMFDLDISANGLLSAQPYFAMWLFSFAYSFLADFLINRAIFTIGTVRKILNSIGMYGPAIALIFLSFYGNVSLTVTMVLLILAVGLNAAALSGFTVNHVDMSPTHSGTLMGITTGSAVTMAILGPLCVQWVVTDEKDTYLWMIIFLTSAAILIVGNTLFVIFGSGEIQPWDPSYGK
ncbi:putative inorganic phosphate cotransporter isoform X2 [Agrilus planipennis]|uniref:Inorganic phosphate cotransporter isoform X2 n=2 Tax=Agrilus planipennis TaxID=224129 RepID=A0A1W4WIV5_AGRPL|nr:putative inorganic phosphate cotransporter isoform X2 [Agrilus planipennis]XP_018323876.1 putative inorganic phosphate cotransporter isoform X2 [Agrilus planipennis]